MSTLVVLGYPSEAEATSAYQKILDLDKNLIVSLQSIAVVAKRADGKCDVVTPDSRVGTSAVWGLFWGALLGLIFFVPFVARRWAQALGRSRASSSNAALTRTSRSACATCFRRTTAPPCSWWWTR